MSSKSAWSALQAAEDERYVKALDQFDPDRLGVEIRCPTCAAQSWLKFPEQRGTIMLPLRICCPKACGHYSELDAFSPTSISLERLPKFDLETVCNHGGGTYKAFGKIARCPFCGIENPRELMRDMRVSVEAALREGVITRDSLADLLGRVVSTFDGVMRACNAIAVLNYENNGIYPTRKIGSFQNVRTAREKLLPDWDMANAVSDWEKFVTMVQKRHCFAHSLGVVDMGYLDNAFDTDARLGENVSLRAEEVSQFACDAEAIVGRFFGYYLS